MPPNDGPVCEGMYGDCPYLHDYGWPDGCSCEHPNREVDWLQEDDEGRPLRRLDCPFWEEDEIDVAH